ncbi:MAG: UDP-N-acetylmuramate dehydrogenase [Ignavibacteria bacterium]|nr:UDP-N-acetylmuramate dehydrogenase [Ignavibacteria bacterium]
MILKNISLLKFNTMSVDVYANYFFTVRTKQDIDKYFNEISKDNILVLGGGSNILFTKNFSGCIIKNEIEGIEVIDEDSSTVIIKAGAGVNWNEFVNFTVDNNWSGIENLILIPGTVGASPVQNIGAYGQEVHNAILSIEAFNLKKLKEITFSNADCKFSYRNSIFKQELKNKIIITSVVFELKKSFVPNFTFPTVANTLTEKKITNPTIRQLADAIIEIRNKKLPDYNSVSNCGSFFTNPFLNKNDFEDFKKNNSDAPFFPYESGYKLSAGWLIEKCGWKGKRIGNVGCYKDHSLVILNYGGATGEEVLQFANMIKQSVMDKFGIMLDYEVNII